VAQISAATVVAELGSLARCEGRDDLAFPNDINHLAARKAKPER
jgi:hypothetical protein